MTALVTQKSNNPLGATEFILKRLQRTRNNEEFLATTKDAI